MKTLALACTALLLQLPLYAGQEAEWTVLFDGDSTDHWRGFRQDSFPEGGWKVKEGVLTSLPKGDRIDIITRDRYTSFELELEWRATPKGNSGIFYRVSEESPVIYHLAPEVQVLDDGMLGTDSNLAHSAGALYDLLPPNEEKELRPAGEFNSFRLVVRGSEVEHWLNGAKILAYDLDSEDLKERIANSKFRAFEGFAREKNGHIGLQHHGSEIGYRNIRIRPLEENASE